MVNSVPTEKINSGRDLHLFILPSICENGTQCWVEPACCARLYFKQALYFLYSSVHTSYFIYNGTFVLLSCFVSRCFCTFVPLHIELVVESRLNLWQSPDIPYGASFSATTSILAIISSLDAQCIFLRIHCYVCIIILKATICLAAKDKTLC